jgi:HlyD family secretion protein
LVPAVVVAAAGLILVYRLGGSGTTEYFASRVERGDIHDVVEATGTVNAVVTVQVGSQVSGSIAKLNVDFNSRVRKGDIIAEIEPSLLRGALLQATADVESAQANLVAARASLAKARAAFVQTKADYERNATLAKGGMITQQELDLARATYEGANASVDVAQANVAQAEAQVHQKTAAESVSRTNLDHTVIRSPINGIVVARNVDVGQTVAASLQAPTIFTIAQDLTKMRVYAKTDESDVGSITVGQPVTFKVDAFPKEVFRGMLSQIRMNPTTVQNVVTYDAIVDFDNVGMRLFPGMTAYVTIPVAAASNVLKIPNAALRYRPPMDAEEVRAEYQRAGITVTEPPASRAAAGQAPANPRQRRQETIVVWKLRPDHTIEPIQLSLGITDHAFTEVAAVLKGTLAVGETVVTRSVVAKSSAPGGAQVRR